MKKTIKLAVVAALALGTTSAFATNGSNLIGLGAKSRGMAGIGIGMSHGAESGLINGALITSVKNTEISFGGTLFMPHVKNTDDLGGGASTEESEAKINLIPEVSLASKINDNFYVGIGMWGTGGMGVDYSAAQSVTAGGTQMKMLTNLQLMQFGVPLAYTRSGFSIAVTPLMQYGSLDINYEYPGTTHPTINQGDTVGMGVAQDLKFGWNLGLAYEYSGLTVGATYKSQIDMQYKGFDTVVSPFTSSGYNNDKLSTPSEFAAGLSYANSGHTLAFDFKVVQWSVAKGYEDFEWKDQNVFVVGYEYAAKKWAVRLGYNYAASPIEEQTNTAANSAGITGPVANTFNLLGFPAVTETHIAAGASFDISDKASVDLAYTYAPEVTNTYTNFNSQDMTVKHSQTGVSAQLNYAF